MFIIFLSLCFLLGGGHFDHSPRVSESLVTTLHERDSTDKWQEILIFKSNMCINSGNNQLHFYISSMFWPKSAICKHQNLRECLYKKSTMH